MKASEAKLLEFMRKSRQLVIPIYQRTYSWTLHECQQLWNDVIRAGGNSQTTAHFVGSIVYIESGLSNITSPESLLVIDGQQRLTTISLMLEALARRLGDREPVADFSARKIRNRFLLDPEEIGDRAFKLLLTQTDKSSLLAVIQQKPMPADHSIRVKENFTFFDESIRRLGEDLSALCLGLAKLVIVDIALSREHDNPQLIFESMNSTGRELTHADLIRNFILMGLEPNDQTALYEDYWRPMETLFGQEAYGSHFDKFMRHYLTVKTGDIPNIGAVYEAFKAYARSPDIAAAGILALVADIYRFAGYYCAMALDKEPDPKLAEAFQDLRELTVDVSYPLLLELYEDYAKGVLTKSDFRDAVRLVESYVFRRAVCGIPTNTLNKTFATFSRSIKKERYLESIQAHLLSLSSYRRFPTDEEFRREIKVRDLYNFRSRSYWLRRLENLNRKERVEINEYTIEHILPQNANLSMAWRTSLGTDWKQVQERWLHTLGNLTLTGYNSEYSDRPFSQKRDREKGGFKQSPLKLNEGLGNLETWNEQTIQERAERLAMIAIEAWPIPSLDQATIDSYEPQRQESAAMTIDSYPYLTGGSAMRTLFEEFRREVCALDPAVTEEPLKLYIAYKAETNFVDVVPQAKRLRLTLNMHFHEVHDPKNLCLDVTNLGHWGNGDVEVALPSIDELPYVVGLVRQSLEKQLGSSDLLIGAPSEQAYGSSAER